jgi:quercetin dioxygenase-like cupin family protein
MPVLHAPEQPTHDLGGSRFTSLATPSRGTVSTAVWTVQIDPGQPAVPHSLTAEEVFVVQSGIASVRLGTSLHTASAGDAIVVPAGVEFELSNATDVALTLLCVFPVGGQAVTSEGTFTPPWAE